MFAWPRQAAKLGGAALLLLSLISPVAADHTIFHTLCQKIDCGVLYLKPKIENVFGWITPDGMVLIAGYGFGATKGNSQILINFSGEPFPFSEELSWAYWSNETVAGQIPDSISGVKDQIVELRVKRNGILSDPYYVFFVAKRDTKALLYSDSVVTLVQCGDDSNYDNCNKVVDGGETPVFWQYGTGCFETFCGIHENVWGAIGDDTGTDKYKVSGLKNQWILDGISVSKYKTSSNEVINDPSPGLGTATTSWNTQMSWKVTPNDRVAYTVSVFITGPIGVPYK